MEGRCEGSLDQQRVIKLSIGLGKFLISGGRVPTIKIRQVLIYIIKLFLKILSLPEFLNNLFCYLNNSIKDA